MVIVTHYIVTACWEYCLPPPGRQDQVECPTLINHAKQKGRDINKSKTERVEEWNHEKVIKEKKMYPQTTLIQGFGQDRDRPRQTAAATRGKMAD
jgi:hypothetical protein